MCAIKDVSQSADMTVKRWLFGVGLCFLTFIVVVSRGFALILVGPIFMLGAPFGVIYGAVRLAIRHERRSEDPDLGGPHPFTYTVS